MTAGDDALLPRLRAGDTHAFEELVETHGPRLLAVARRYLRQDADAQDALQDALISAHRALPRFNGEAALGSWLHRIVVRACLMKLRSAGRRKDGRSIEDLLPRFHADGHRVNPEPAWTETADSLAARAETRAMVRQCIDELPDDYREVLMLRDIDGFDTDETARLLEMNPNSVKTRLHRARQALRTLLEPHVRRGSL